MCDWCDNKRVLIEDEVVNPWILQWMGTFKSKDIEGSKYNISIFIDRGYLRLVDKDGCNCFDHGEKFKINYCPICGNEV